MKKLTFKISFITIVSFLTLTNTFLYAGGNSYLLECRGGGNMFARISIHYRNWVNFYNIKHSRFAAGKRAPGPGECAWIDRPLSANEPYEIWYGKKSKRLLHHVDISSNRVNIGWERNPIINVINKMKNGQLFYLHVKSVNSGSGSKILQITKIGP